MINRNFLLILISLLFYGLIFGAYIFIDLHPTGDEALSKLIRLELRLPRALVATLLAFGISAAGCITQTIFQNPLASPSVLGASSGAVLMTLLTQSAVTTSFQPLTSFIGALLILFLFLIFWRLFSKSSIESLLIFGFATNTLISAINQLIISLNILDYEKTTTSLLFLMGDLSAKSWKHVTIGCLTIIPALIVATLRSQTFDILALGRDIAGNLGLNVNRAFIEAITLAGFMIGGAISIGGIFPFLGLVLPFITRNILGPSLKSLIPTTCLFAASITLLIDFFAQNVVYPQVLYSGVVMALIGSPIFILILLRQRLSI